MSFEREAQLMLELNGVILQEVQGQVRNTVFESAKLEILGLSPTEEEARLANAKLGLAPDTIKPGVTLHFVVCETYKFPLCSTVPMIRNADREYVFVTPGLFVALIFPPHIREEEIDTFEEIVKAYGTFREKVPRAGQAVVVAQPPVDRATQISEALTGIGVKTVTAIQKGSDFVQQRIDNRTSNYVTTTPACEVPVAVPQAYRDHARRTRMVTKSAVMISSGLAQAMIGVSGALSTQLAGTISKKYPGTSDPKLDGVKKVAGTTVGVAGGVILAASQATRAILTTGLDGISKVVTHKYGNEAGELAKEGGGIVSDAYQISTNMETVGLKGMVKVIGKDTAKRLVDAQEMEQARAQMQASPQQATLPAPPMKQ